MKQGTAFLVGTEVLNPNRTARINDFQLSFQMGSYAAALQTGPCQQQVVLYARAQLQPNSNKQNSTTATNYQLNPELSQS